MDVNFSLDKINEASASFLEAIGTKKVIVLQAYERYRCVCNKIIDK